MPGTKEGGRKGAITMKKRYGNNVYEVIGAAGGRAVPKEKRTWSADREAAAAAGRRGGSASRRKKTIDEANESGIE